jgi:hypothetical protein
LTKTFVYLLSLVLAVATLSCQRPEPAAPIGMTLHPRGADAATLGREFDLMAEMGMTWVRMDVDWSVVEAQQSRLDWTTTDAIVDLAAARGMKVLGVIAFSPAWSRASGTGAEPTTDQYARPDQLTSYANFARVVAERYTPRGVHSWEIWNEPNTAKFWPPQPDANEYGNLFRAAADAIRGVDPGATLLIGGLGPQFEVPGREVAPADYLERLYDSGAAQLADGVAAHPYTFPALPMDDNQRTVGGFKDLPALHTVMERHGDGGKKIWITEFGAPTGTHPTAMSEDAQAAALQQARDQVSHWDWAGPLIYYELVDGGTDPADTEQNFGVLRADLAPKPAAKALMDAHGDSS